MKSLVFGLVSLACVVAHAAEQAEAAPQTLESEAELRELTTQEEKVDRRPGFSPIIYASEKKEEPIAGIGSASELHDISDHQR
jgi:hypothetical protein